MPLGHEFGLARENWAASGRVRHATSRQANAEMRFKPDRPLELSTFPSEISLPNFLERESGLLLITGFWKTIPTPLANLRDFLMIIIKLGGLISSGMHIFKRRKLL